MIGDLMAAAKTGDAPTVERLLAGDPSLATARGPGPCGESTALHVAAENDHLEICRTLLDGGADVHARDEGDHATPLHWAAFSAGVPVVELLIEHGADVDATDDLHEGGPLGWAVCLWVHRPEAARVLLERGARLSIFAAVALEHEPQVRQLVEREPALLRARQSQFELHRSPLHLAAYKDLPRMIDLLIELGADPAHMDSGGRTALDRALIDGRTQAVETLESHGSKPSAGFLEEVGSIERACRIQSLNAAACEGDAAKARELLAEDSTLATAQALEGPHTILHTASWHGRTEVARLLIEHGADINVRDGEYESPPIGWAKENRQQEMVELLLASGAEVEDGGSEGI